MSKGHHNRRRKASAVASMKSTSDTTARSTPRRPPSTRNSGARVSFDPLSFLDPRTPRFQFAIGD